MTTAVIYRPRHQVQKLRYEGALIGCTETSAAMLVDAVTLGGCTVTELDVRKLSGEWPPDPDSPGLRQSQLVTALGRLHIYYRNMTGRDWAQLVRALDAGRRLVIQGVGEGFASVPHALHAQAIRNGRMLVNNPTRTEAEWVDVDIIRAGMRRLAGGDGLYWGQSKTVPRKAVG